MTDLRQRATKFLQQRFPRAPVLGRTVQLVDRATGTFEKPIHLLIAYDTDAAIKQSLIAIPNLGSHDEIGGLIRDLPKLIDELKSSVWMEGGNALTGHLVGADQMLNSPKLIIYTDALHCQRSSVIDTFGRAGNLIDLIHESEMHSSVFISYGGMDEEIARSINRYLVSHSVTTWFFPEDALPGQKLHRVMSYGVSKHDRVILICSESSLQRLGVQNELERVLERESREGGSEILIPVTIDRYVFDDWKPARSDLADQVRSRVIATFPASASDVDPFNAAAEKLLKALKR